MAKSTKKRLRAVRVAKRLAAGPCSPARSLQPFQHAVFVSEAEYDQSIESVLARIRSGKVEPRTPLPSRRSFTLWTNRLTTASSTVFSYLSPLMKNLLLSVLFASVSLAGSAQTTRPPRRAANARPAASPKVYVCEGGSAYAYHASASCTGLG